MQVGGQGLSANLLMIGAEQLLNSVESEAAVQEKKHFAAFNDVSLQFLQDIELAGIAVPTTIGGGRYYSDGQQIRIKIALKARRLGFSLQEIKLLIDAAGVKSGE